MSIAGKGEAEREDGKRHYNSVNATVEAFKAINVHAVDGLLARSRWILLECPSGAFRSAKQGPALQGKWEPCYRAMRGIGRLLSCTKIVRIAMLQ